MAWRAEAGRCRSTRGDAMTSSVNPYDSVYGDFASTAEVAVRQQAYGEDLGQSSWLTAREWLGFTDQLGIGPGAEVLEVGSGSGGPAAYLAAVRDCRVTAVDINDALRGEAPVKVCLSRGEADAGLTGAA
jgi:hypothetical protein